MRHFINWQQSPQASYLARLMFPEPTARLDIEVDLVVEISVQNPFDFFLEETAENFPFGFDPTSCLPPVNDTGDLLELVAIIEPPRSPDFPFTLDLRMIPESLCRSSADDSLIHGRRRRPDDRGSGHDF